MAEDIQRLMKHAHDLERRGRKADAVLTYDAASEIARMRAELTWQLISTAPQDGTVFLARNYDGELWVAKFITNAGTGPQLVFRTNENWEPRSFIVHEIDGKRLLEEDEEYAKANEKWHSHWSYWRRGYEFKPTHWMRLSPPPMAQGEQPVRSDMREKD